MIPSFWKLSIDGTLLALESHTVIAMRLTSAALGRATQAENTRMVTEKLAAFAEAAAILITGGSSHKVIRSYRKHVQANMRRLRA